MLVVILQTSCSGTFILKSYTYLQVVYSHSCQLYSFLSNQQDSFHLVHTLYMQPYSHSRFARLCVLIPYVTVFHLLIMFLFWVFFLSFSCVLCVFFFPCIAFSPPLHSHLLLVYQLKPWSCHTLLTCNHSPDQLLLLSPAIPHSSVRLSLLMPYFCLAFLLPLTHVLLF